MNTPGNERPSANSEPPPGSALDNITAETPVCPTKNVQCPYWTAQGCKMDVCWMGAGGEPNEQQRDTVVVINAFAELAQLLGLTLDLAPERIEELIDLVIWLKRCGDVAGRTKDIVTALYEYYERRLKTEPAWWQPDMPEMTEKIRKSNEEITAQPLPATVEEASEQVRQRADLMRLFGRANLPAEMLAAMTIYWPSLRKDRFGPVNETIN